MDEQWKIFVETLKEIETLIAARQCVPKENETYESMKDLIERSSESLTKQHRDIIGSDGKIATECPRLFKLFGLLDDVPKAKDAVMMILETEISKTGNPKCN